MLKGVDVFTHHQLLVDNHLVDDGVNHRQLQLKHVSEGYETERVVDGAVGEEVGAKTLLLDLLRQQRLHGHAVVEQVPHL